MAGSLNSLSLSCLATAKISIGHSFYCLEAGLAGLTGLAASAKDAQKEQENIKDCQKDAGC